MKILSFSLAILLTSSLISAAIDELGNEIYLISIYNDGEASSVNNKLFHWGESLWVNCSASDPGKTTIDLWNNRSITLYYRTHQTIGLVKEIASYALLPLSKILAVGCAHVVLDNIRGEQMLIPFPNDENGNDLPTKSFTEYLKHKK